MDVPQKSIHLKTIDVDEDFESVYYDNKIDNDVEYEIIRSQKSLKKITSPMIHNDLRRSRDIRREVADENC